MSSVEVTLSVPEYKRYGRQMILDGFGLPGQLALKSARVAVIGAGGLGCPALQYLVGAGVGFIGIFDFDKVEESNLHRQILHTSARVGWYKAESAKASLVELNPYVKVEAITTGITPSNALSLLEPYSLVLDCTDRPQTRYLISDATVRLSLSLVSGAAIRQGGQWAIYGGVGQNGRGPRRACYRCIWPKPLPTEPGRGTCEEEGVWGCVTGMVGTAMASEAIKVILGTDDPAPRLTMMSLATSVTPFRSIKIRGQSPKCPACGDNPSITNDLESVGYDAFCGVSSGDTETSEVERVSVQQLSEVQRSKQRDTSLVLDVRPAVEYGICAIPGSINLPLQQILRDPASAAAIIPAECATVYAICRRGNDSLLAAGALQRHLASQDRGGLAIRDVQGGVRAWATEVDPEFPTY